jgi:quinol monooxygenase YgiN
VVIVLGRMDIHPEDAAAGIALAKTMAEETRKEGGCLLYTFAEDLALRSRFWLAERWRDADALAEHFKTSHMMEFRAGLQTLRLVHFSAYSYGITNETELIRIER